MTLEAVVISLTLFVLSAWALCIALSVGFLIYLPSLHRRRREED